MGWQVSEIGFGAWGIGGGQWGGADHRALDRDGAMFDRGETVSGVNDETAIRPLVHHRW